MKSGTGTQHNSIYIYMYIYIYPLMGCEGARKRSKTRLQRNPRRAAKEPEANGGGQNATKIGFSDVSKVVKNFVFSPFWRAAYDQNGTRRQFFDRPSQLFKFCVLLGFGDLAAEWKLRKRFVSASFASGGVFGAPCFLPQK